MTFDRVTQADLPALAFLWQEAFLENAEKLVPWLLQTGTGFCCREEQTLCAMAFALPYAVASEGAILDGRYLYGVATRKTHRGRGIATRLLEHVERELAAEGADGLLLVPADDGLRRFYRERGFRDWSVRFPRSAEGETPCDAAEYLRLREAHLAGTPHIFPPEEVIGRCRFFKSDAGCRAELFGKTAESLPQEPGGTPYAMAKPLTAQFPRWGFFSFAMDE